MVHRGGGQGTEGGDRGGGQGTEGVGWLTEVGDREQRVWDGSQRWGDRGEWNGSQRWFTEVGDRGGGQRGWGTEVGDRGGGMAHRGGGQRGFTEVGDRGGWDGSQGWGTEGGGMVHRGGGQRGWNFEMVWYYAFSKAYSDAASSGSYHCICCIGVL